MAETEELARKKRLRAGHRASTTRILGQVQPSIADDPLDVPKITQLKRSLEDKLVSLSGLDERILELTPEDAIETEIVQADEIKERIYVALSELDHCLSPKAIPGRAPPLVDPSPEHPPVDPPPVDPPPVHPPEHPPVDPPPVDPPPVHPPEHPPVDPPPVHPPEHPPVDPPPVHPPEHPPVDPPPVDLPPVRPPPGDPPPVHPPTVDHPTGKPPSADLPDSAASGTTHYHQGAKVRLPKISLPRFNGDPVKWTTFWDSYQSAIHLNPDLSEVDKFNYLRSLLDSTAFEAIAGLTLSSANYQQAIEILRKRFGNKQVIISKHMDTLMIMDAISSDRHLRDLRRLYDNTEAHVRSLKSLGIEASSYGALLSPVLLAKLPPELRLIVSRKVSDSNLDMDALLATFEEELMARERANPQATRRGQERPRPTTSTLFSGSQDSNTDPRCAYCQQPHSSASCSSVTDVAARKQSLRSSGRCFNCLRRNHVSRNCKSSSRCHKCKKKHHTSICDFSSSRPQSLAHSAGSGLNPEAPPYQSNPTTSNLCSDNLQAVFLQTARAVIHDPDKPQVSLEVRLLLDSGSQKSYISERARGLLHLDTRGEQSLSIATFGSDRGSVKVCPIVSVGMHLKGYPSMSLSLYVVNTICEPLVGQPLTTCIEQHSHLLGLELADFSSSDSSLPVDVLIGSDYYWELVTGSVCRGASGPTAVHTKLGWVLSGPLSHNDPSQCAMNLSVTHVLHSGTVSEYPHTLGDQLRAFWELEALGIRDEERTLYDDFTAVVKFENGRYKVPLPWREFHDPLPTNYQLSVNRLQGLLRRLKQDPNVLKEYDSIIQDQLQQGIIEAIPADEASPKAVHFLPHHAVVRRDKSTTKVRVVYDASAKSGSSPSLNDCLLKGPKFNQLIFDLLIRFRSYKIALTADLEKAFLMVSVDEADRDVLRFVWVDDAWKDLPDLRVYRFTRVVFGVSSSPFLLNATIRFHLEKYLEHNEGLVHHLLRSTYVDDIISGGPTEDEVFDLYTESKKIFYEGGFNLRKFLTNSPQLQERIDRQESPKRDNPPQQDEPTFSEATLGVSRSPRMEEHKVLGVPWNSESDQLIFDVTDLARLARDLHPTKRNLVSLIGKFYDPLGFLSPVIIRFKILFQKLCQCKSDWDEVIPEELVKEWKSLISDLQQALPISLPRSYLVDIADPLTSMTLCGFCDASTQAFAAVVYLLLKTKTCSVVRFVAAKTRVAPLQPQTVPRLELLSAFLLSRLVVSVHNSLQHQMTPLDIRCYTDSQVALYWIRGTGKEWKPFVQNRVREIRRNVHPDLWNHCPGRTNPADLPSRGLCMLELSVSQLWRTGPGWLSMDAPICSDVEPVCMPELCASELKAGSKLSHNLLAIERSNSVGEVISCEDFSTLQRLLRVTAYVQRAVNHFKTRKASDPNHQITLTPPEIATAEMLWITHVQKELVLQKDFDILRSQFGLFLDDRGLWRCGGRLQNADMPFTAKHPVLLPRKHPFTALIIRDAHQRVRHNGVKETLTEIRRRYWIVKGRNLIKAIIHGCTVCKKHEGAPFDGPPPPPLPEFRIKENPAFTYTGADFAGPLFVRNHSSSSSTKVWICLFTCLVTRAIHLDVVSDLLTETFIRCLKRFAARRGLPHKFLSDNGKTFKAAAKFLSVVFKDKTIQEYLANKGSQWIFNIERAPWWGGAFERMIKSTKRCLRKMVGRANLSHDELLTTVVEIEAVINSRPLSYISAADYEEPLTPSHLLVGRRLLNLPDHLEHICNSGDEDFEVNASQLSKRMKHLASVLNHFWKRWRSEYLNELRESHRYSAKKTKRCPSVSRGDVVIVHDDALPRGFWKLGQIQEVLTGRDGQSRAALVRVATRDRQHILLRRPLQLLYPLEICGTEPLEPGSGDMPASTSDDLTSSPVEEDNVPALKEPERRPMRAAAKRANEKRRAWIQELHD